MIKKGDSVIMVNCYEADHDKYSGKIFKVITDPQKMCGSDVVWLEGYSGCFDLDCLKKIKV